MIQSKPEQKSKAIVKYGPDRLEKAQRVGMRGVDPMDIRPPQILLAQALSDFDRLIEPGGKKAEIGQFFHTGQLKIYDTFKCYFIFAAKSKYTNRRKPEEGEKDQYRAMGMLEDGLSLFAMTFRSSSLFTLSPLFSAASFKKRPMFSFLCEMETKKLSGKEGDWFIPVLRIKGLEKDLETLTILDKQAAAFDVRNSEVSEKDIDEIDQKVGYRKPKKDIPF